MTQFRSKRSGFGRSRVWVWYAQCLLHELVLIFPTYAIMMQDTGISPAGFASLIAIWSATVLLFEVPSGVVGDLFSRKTVLVIAGVIRSAAFGTWLLWPTYWGFALGFIIWSLGSALHSGTSEAFLYESIERKQGFEKAYGRTQAAYGIGAALALSIGGYAAETGYRLPLILSVIAPISASVLIALFLVNPPRRHSDDSPTFMELVKSGARAVVEVRILALLVSMSAVLASVPGIFEEYLGLILDESGFTLTAVGLTYGLVWLGRTIGTLVAHRLKSQSLTRLAMLPMVASVLYLVAMSGPSLMFVGGFIVYFAIFGIFDVLLGARLQHAVKDHHRATITSISSMAVEGSGIIYALVIGLLAQYLGWSTAFLLSTIAGLGFACIFIRRAYTLTH
jgi:MFS family permease